jgi:hypothetical protein
MRRGHYRRHNASDDRRRAFLSRRTENAGAFGLGELGTTLWHL